MNNQVAHNLLNSSTFLEKAILKGYSLYNLGTYPGIKKTNEEQAVLGELYEIDEQTLIQLDTYEDEGNLYNRIPVQIEIQETNEIVSAFTYGYRGIVDTHKLIPLYLQPYGKDTGNLIWYVTYGSNLLLERFTYYIKGGEYNGKSYKGCKDKTLPLAQKRVTIQYLRYFGKSSSRWDHRGVAFLDSKTPGNTTGRAYLITQEQLKDIQKQEGSWYDLVLKLPNIDSLPAATLTSTTRHSDNGPSEEYKKVIKTGMIETFKLA
jgi:gamma-glutamylcyclotransferase (GGCT)/AIG2-like uncharacterized protein YtfP